MRIAICDEKKADRQNIAEALHDIEKSENRSFSVNEFDDGNELLQSHAHLPYDLLFLDILMPKISGMEIAEQLRKTDTHTPIIFVSASDEFGVQSYRVLAFDYLLKPVGREQLRRSMQRLLKRSDFENEAFLTISYAGTDTKIRLSNIQCLESNLHKVVITLSEKRSIEISAKLSDFEDFLSDHGFCRCHKSYLVNMEHIDRIDGDTFLLTGGKNIKISRAYLQNAKKAYFDFVFGTEVRL